MDLCMFLYHLIMKRLLLTALLFSGIDCQANQVSATSEECNAAWGICNVRRRIHTHFLETAHQYS